MKRASSIKYPTEERYIFVYDGLAVQCVGGLKHADIKLGKYANS